MRNVSKVVQHENFDSLTSDFDITLLKLAFPYFASPTINTIPLATSLPTAGSLVALSGFGTASVRRFLV